MATLRYPPEAAYRPGFWVRLGNIWAARRILRRDRSNEWRYAFTGGQPAQPPSRSRPFSYLHDKSRGDGFRFLILGDTGEGDRSQYGTLPLIRALEPDFMIINGDVVYPAGRMEDFRSGFFQPYRGLGIPIWAVPGNHDYYSADRGRELYDVFCTTIHAGLWDEHGLDLRPQPGTYWELAEPGVPLVVIGLDSGHGGRLDGGRGVGPDERQHRWLEWRLGVADRAGVAVIVLFHIPALAKQEHVGKTALTTLHRILGSHPSVRLVVCGHEHNFQRYAPQLFADYLEREHGRRTAGKAPNYVVSGGGGAFLHATEFRSRAYPAETVYPSPEQWRRYARAGREIVSRLGLGKWLIGRIVALSDQAALADGDAAQLLSFLLVEVKSPSARVTPVYLDSVGGLFAHLPEGSVVDVAGAEPPVSADAVALTLQRDNAIELGEEV